MRLIDADAFEVLSWKATKKQDYDSGFADGVRFAVEKMDEAQTVDAVPVVRCKDCKYWVFIDKDNGIGYGECMNDCAVIRRDAWPNEDYFCADGERKDGGRINGN